MKKLPHKIISYLKKRRGAATVEFAVVCPIFFLLIFGGIELGRAVMVKHVLEEAARAGVRVASINDPVRQDVIDIVDSAMATAGITGYTITISPDPPTDAVYKDVVTVTVSVPYTDVSWTGPNFMKDTILVGAAIMPAEAESVEWPNIAKNGKTKKVKGKKTKGTKKTKKTK